VSPAWLLRDSMVTPCRPSSSSLTGMTETTRAEGDGECTCAPCRERAHKKCVRAGRWIVRHSDLTKPPTPLIRWAILLATGLGCWAAGVPLDVKDWLGPMIIAGALILPDVAGFGIAGVRLDLKQTQDEVATMRQEVNAQARATARAGAILALGDEAIKTLPGLGTIADIVNAGRPGAASTAQPLDPAEGG
jgi:hypothetical protein